MGTATKSWKVQGLTGVNNNAALIDFVATKTSRGFTLGTKETYFVVTWAAKVER